MEDNHQVRIRHRFCLHDQARRYGSQAAPASQLIWRLSCEPVVNVCAYAVAIGYAQSDADYYEAIEVRCSSLISAHSTRKHLLVAANHQIITHLVTFWL